MKIFSLVMLILMTSTSVFADPDTIDPVHPLHSHNDYAQHRILQEALDHDFKSIEADIWISKGQIKVSHYPWSFKGTLEDLYLKPLQLLVNESKLKTSPENPLLLWLDIKDLRSSIVDKLAYLLSKYPMVGKEVKIILTGNKRLKRKFFEQYPEINVERDENSMDVEPEMKPTFTWYTLKWKKYSDWKADREITPEQYQELKLIVDRVHAEGRQIRFFASPANERYWKVMDQLGVDLMDTDDIPELEQFFESLHIKIPSIILPVPEQNPPKLSDSKTSMNSK